MHVKERNAYDWFTLEITDLRIYYKQTTVTRITRKDKHKEQVNTENADSDYASCVGMLKCSWGTGMWKRYIGRPLSVHCPTCYRIQSRKQLSKPNTDPFPMYGTMIPLTKLIKTHLSKLPETGLV